MTLDELEAVNPLLPLLFSTNRLAKLIPPLTLRTTDRNGDASSVTTFGFGIEAIDSVLDSGSKPDARGNEQFVWVLQLNEQGLFAAVVTETSAFDPRTNCAIMDAVVAASDDPDKLLPWIREKLGTDNRLAGLAATLY